jgi:hypothetical protein
VFAWHAISVFIDLCVHECYDCGHSINAIIDISSSKNDKLAFVGLDLFAGIINTMLPVSPFHSDQAGREQASWMPSFLGVPGP